jgi:hypothetical protein
MASYGYTVVDSAEWEEKMIRLKSTDPRVIEWFRREVKDLAPDCNLKAIRDWQKFPSGEPCYAEAARLKDHLWPVYNWLVKQLCQSGWEPFAQAGDETDLSSRIHLRMRYD